MSHFFFFFQWYEEQYREASELDNVEVFIIMKDDESNGDPPRKGCKKKRSSGVFRLGLSSVVEDSQNSCRGYVPHPVRVFSNNNINVRITPHSTPFNSILLFLFQVFALQNLLQPLLVHLTLLLVVVVVRTTTTRLDGHGPQILHVRRLTNL